jgi:8-oxo-dGTP pyrophosphatase MutT (NUDIX family)
LIVSAAEVGPPTAATSGVRGPFAVSRLEVRAGDRNWHYAEANAREIEAYFAAEVAKNPTLFNGPMLMADRWSLRGDVLEAGLCRTDFASFLHWRNAYRQGRLPDLAGTLDLFGSAAVFSGDGRLLIARMADHTANAGLHYTPCGSLDDADVGADGRIDIDGAMRRELGEETGLDLAAASAEPGYTVFVDGPRLAILRAWRYAETAARLAARIRLHLARDETPELAEICFVAGVGDVDTGRCQAYTVAYLRHRFRRG